MEPAHHSETCRCAGNVRTEPIHGLLRPRSSWTAIRRFTMPRPPNLLRHRRDQRRPARKDTAAPSIIAQVPTKTPRPPAPAIPARLQRGALPRRPERWRQFRRPTGRDRTYPTLIDAPESKSEPLRWRARHRSRLSRQSDCCPNWPELPSCRSPGDTVTTMTFCKAVAIGRSASSASSSRSANVIG